MARVLLFKICGCVVLDILSKRFSWATTNLLSPVGIKSLYKKREDKWKDNLLLSHFCLKKPIASKHRGIHMI